MIENSRLQWISSAGGPLVLLQYASFQEWQGVLSDDYQRAGAVSGFVGVITKADHDVLVLWGEPMETAYYHLNGRHFLVQWSYAPDEESVLRALPTFHSNAATLLSETRLGIVDDTQFLIDAGAPATHAQERLVLNLAPGRYVVKTFVYRPSADTELMMHELQPESN